MPFYADSQFNTRDLVPCASTFTASLTGTGTAVTSGGVLTAGFFPVFIRRTAIRNVQIQILTAPVGGVTAGLITFYNGTNAIGTATVGTLTAGQSIALAVSGANSTFTDASGPTGTFTGTVTSAGTGAGGYAIWFDSQELYE